MAPSRKPSATASFIAFTTSRARVSTTASCTTSDFVIVILNLCQNFAFSLRNGNCLPYVVGSQRSEPRYDQTAVLEPHLEELRISCPLQHLVAVRERGILVCQPLEVSVGVRSPPSR